MRINIIYHNNGAGLTVDANIIESVLSEHAVNKIDIYKRSKHLKADLNIYLEVVDYRCFRLAPRNVFIPNPEWFMNAWKRTIRKFDCVWCKTHDAVKIFKGMGLPTEYLSFTSPDRYMPGVMRDPVYLHLQGQSETKGTKQILRAWTRDMPRLIIVSQKRLKVPDYIMHHFGRLGNEAVKKLQNRCLYHLCPSEYEGFGHCPNQKRINY